MMAPLQFAQREPIHDVHPVTGVNIEVFFANRALETFGRSGVGWFWWPRLRGCPPKGPAIGPFPTRYSAYRDALQTGEMPGRLQQGCNADARIKFRSEGR